MTNRDLATRQKLSNARNAEQSDILKSLKIRDLMLIMMRDFIDIEIERMIY